MIEMKNENLIEEVGKFLNQVRFTAVTIFICGIIISALITALNFVAGFMVFASTTGFFGGLLLSEDLFYRLMEVKV